MLKKQFWTNHFAYFNNKRATCQAKTRIKFTQIAQNRVW